jgi:uncharacterized protein (TIGR01777 family)
MIKKILITGASGLIGAQLTKMMLQKGYQVVHLGRTKKQGEVKSYVWDVANHKIDSEALEGVTTIIHLAGAGVADKRWNEARKKEILDSRIQSTQLLFDTLKKTNHQVESFISASAIGYYGFTMEETVFTEDSNAGSDFLAQVTRQWEQEVDKISSLGIRTVKMRIGIVLSNRGGALVEMAKPIRLGAGAALGTGKQQMSWIHIDDLCAMFMKAAEDAKMNGAYNAVCDWTTNADFTKAVAKILNRPLLLPPVPAFAMKLLIGEMAAMIVNGSKVSSEKIRKTGFEFQYPDLQSALIAELIKQEGV